MVDLPCALYFAVHCVANCFVLGREDDIKRMLFSFFIEILKFLHFGLYAGIQRRNQRSHYVKNTANYSMLRIGIEASELEAHAAHESAAGGAKAVAFPYSCQLESCLMPTIFC